MDQYKTFFEMYGCMLTSDYAGVTPQYVSRVAKAKGWKAPSCNTQRKNVLNAILKSQQS
ncbi:hypothetical protein K7103_004197 [Vibrio parahaemolyticus]|nr:hypothetical protein [Vibrio parahaemolyticus]